MPCLELYAGVAATGQELGSERAFGDNDCRRKDCDEGWVGVGAESDLSDVQLRVSTTVVPRAANVKPSTVL